MAGLALLTQPAQAQPKGPLGPGPLYGSQMPVTVAGGTARTLAASLGDLTDVLNLLPQTSPSVDYTSTINTALAAGKKLWLPNTGTCYAVSSTIQAGTAGAALIGQPGTTLCKSDTSTTFRVLAASVTFQDITFDLSSLAQAASRPIAYAQAANFTWNGGGMHYGGATFLNAGASYAKISNLVYDYSSAGGITINGADHASVTDSLFHNNFGFSVFATTGSTYFIISRNKIDNNAIEGIATGWQAYFGTITDNIVTASADNCFSISGRNNVVSGNQAAYCLGNGFAIYGDFNTVTGNKAINNSQVNNTAAPAIALWNGTTKAVYHSPGYGTSGFWGINLTGANGGYSQYNTVTGNLIYDDQGQADSVYPAGSVTQLGIAIGAGTGVWVASTAYSVGTYAFANSATYQVTTGGTSAGSGGPSGTGTAITDGSVVWSYVSTPPNTTTREASGNIIGPNTIGRFSGSTDITDNTQNHGNTVFNLSYTTYSGANSITGIGTSPTSVKGGFQQARSAWVNGTTTYVYGDERSNNHVTYRLVAITTPGSAVSVAPSGTTVGASVAGADGYTWMCLGSDPVYGVQQTFLGGKITQNGVVTQGAVDSTTNFCPRYAGSGTPLGKVAAPICATYTRTDGGTGTTLYVKESATDTSGWVAK